MIIVVMGVAGSGKTRIGTLLAGELGWPFFDADDFHPPENIARMASGVPLDDADRIPWLDAIHAKLVTVANAVVACSALKETYRRRLRAALDVRFVHLRGEYAMIESRLRERQDHFFAPDLLESQFDSLEPPDDAIEVDASEAPEIVVRQITSELRVR